MKNVMFDRKPPEAQIEEIDELIRNGDSPARSIWKRIKSFVENFESQLDDEHEVMIDFLELPASGITEVQSVSYWSPDILMFTCISDIGTEIVLLQHYSQLNFFVCSRKKKDPSRPKHTIRFTTEPHDDENGCHSQSQE